MSITSCLETTVFDRSHDSIVNGSYCICIHVSIIHVYSKNVYIIDGSSFILLSVVTFRLETTVFDRSHDAHVNESCYMSIYVSMIRVYFKKKLYNRL